MIIYVVGRSLSVNLLCDRTHVYINLGQPTLNMSHSESRRYNSESLVLTVEELGERVLSRKANHLCVIGMLNDSSQ